MYLLSRMYEMLALNRASLHTLEPEGEEAPAARSGRRPSLPAATHKVNAIHRQVSEPAGGEAQAARGPAAGVPIGRRYSAPSMVFSVNENDSEDTTRLQPVLESPRRENTIS